MPHDYDGKPRLIPHYKLVGTLDFLKLIQEDNMHTHRTHTEVLMDLLLRWRDGDVSNTVLRRDLSGMAANADLLETQNADLLEALEYVLTMCSQWKVSGCGCPVCANTRQAIEKAKGEQHATNTEKTI